MLLQFGRIFGLGVGVALPRQHLGQRRSALIDTHAERGQNVLKLYGAVFGIGFIGIAFRDLEPHQARKRLQGLGKMDLALAGKPPPPARRIVARVSIGMLYRKRRLALPPKPVKRPDEADAILYEGLVQVAQFSCPADKIRIARLDVAGRNFRQCSFIQAPGNGAVDGRHLVRQRYDLPVAIRLWI